MFRGCAVVSTLILAAACGGDGGTGPTTIELRDVSIISAGANTTCALDSFGAAYCWGANASGQVGDGTTSTRTVPTRVAGDHVFSSIRAGLHSCGLTLDGAFCWGYGESGRLGSGGSASASVPVALATGTPQFGEMDIGGSSCALANEGTYCWGPNDAGQLGTGDDQPRDRPTLIEGDLVLARLSVGDATACGLTAVGGQAWCWGEGSNGELGTGSFELDSDVPVAVAGGMQFVSISVGGTRFSGTVCAITVEGRGYCWGDNSNGQLGTGTTTRSSVPVPIVGTLNLSEIVVGAGFACGRTVAAVAYCWGAGGFLGTGLDGPSPVPVQVSGNLSFATLTAGDRHACGRTEDADVVYCWGANESGQLGDGSTDRRLSPVRVAGQP